MPVADGIKPALPIIHVTRGQAAPLNGANQTFPGISAMLRLVLALAIATPLLGGCIIIASDKPTTRVIQSAPVEAAQ